MDFTISEKMKTILGMIDEFVDRELIPLELEFLTKSARSLLPVFEEKRRMVRQMELWAPNHPKEYGGIGLNLTIPFWLISIDTKGPPVSTTVRMKSTRFRWPNGY